MKEKNLIDNFNGNRKLLVEALIKNPEGVESSKLTQITGISNKADVKKYVNEILKNYNLTILLERTSGRQHKWRLCEI